MNSRHVLIVHGTKGGPDINWFPWLKKELEDKGHTVSLPRFPTPENQSFDSWLAIAEQHLKNIDPANTILVGHSSGAAFVLRLAERTPTPFHALFAVCPFVDDIGIPEYNALNASFLHHDFDWGKIKRGAQKFVLFAGDNDPYVPSACAEKVARHLSAPLHIIKNGGHLNGESGFHAFDALLRDMKDALKNP